ncbi:peptidylprolyl isomerase [Meiothermus sp. QL-1]|uniref:peptidylprolyl isomerase n=1 Tax=Meiothermus sp. QL-1 TaxID=2058095 RepID=UPI000E0AE1A9|nr:peptidylprolyl isomerase [Meiothermus sp. QL-1]RDI96665.1 peptidylprolyl isomerase [Meiothermus sp. QL-1]
MLRRVLVLLWGFFGLALAQADPVVAVVGHTTIRKSHFEIQFGLFVRDFLRQRGQPYTPEALELFAPYRAEYLKRMVQDRAVILAAEQAGFAAQKEAVERAIEEVKAEFAGEEVFEQALKEAGIPDLEAYRALVYEVLTYDAYLEHLSARLRVSQPALRLLYLFSKPQFTLPQRYCAAHILLKTAQEARQVIARLNRGEKFADLAKALSQDPGSRAEGGNLGCEPRGTFVAPFELALLALKPGEVSKTPVQTEFGFHVILLVRVLMPEIQPYEEVQSLLSRRVQDLALQKLLTSLAQRTPSRLYPENL